MGEVFPIEKGPDLSRSRLFFVCQSGIMTHVTLSPIVDFVKSGKNPIKMDFFKTREAFQ